MTQPDQYFPGTATNVATPGFSAYTQKTQADYEADRKAPWNTTLGPLAALCSLIDTLPIVKSLMNLGSSFDAGNTSNILHGLQGTVNQLAGLVCTIGSGVDVDINKILDEANAMLAAAEANPFYVDIVNVGQAVLGPAGNVLTDLINGVNYWLGDLMGFLNNPAGLGTGIVTGVISAARIAALDASKIVSGIFSLPLIPSLPATIITSGLLNAAQIPGLDATKIVSGLLSAAQIPSLPAGWGKTIDATLMANVTVANTASWLTAADQSISDFIYQATHGGTTTGNALSTIKTSLLNFPGVNIVSNIVASVVPALDASKITTGVFGVPLIPSLPATIITSGLLNAAQIPGLDATKIVSGLLGAAQIPSLPAGWGKTIDATLMANVTVANTGSWLTAGEQNISDYVYQATHGGTSTGNALSTIKTSLLNFPGANVVSAIAASVVPVLDASKITTGVFGVPLIPSLPATIVTSGLFNAAQIPGLDASKIVTGTFANAMSPGLLPQTLWQATTVAAKNLVISPNFEDATVTREAFLNPGGGSWAYSTDVARSGTQSYKVITSNAGTENDGVVLSPNTIGGTFSGSPFPSAIKVQGGQWFYAEIYVRGKATNTTTAGIIYLGTIVKDSSGVNSQTFPAFNANSSTTYFANMSGLSSSAWTKISGWLQIPAGYDSLWPVIYLQNQNVANQTFYFDDGRVVEDTQAQSLTQQLFGGSSILTTVLAGVVPGLDATKIISGVFGTGLIPNLPASIINSGTFVASLIPGLDATKIVSGVLATAQVAWAAPIDTLVQAWGGTGTGHTTGDLTTFARAVPNQYIQGLLGNSQIGGTVANFADTIVQSVNSSTATGNSLGVLGGAISALRGFLGFTTGGAAPTGSVANIATNSGQWITNTSTTKPIWANSDPTMDSTFQLSDINTATLVTTPTLANTAGTEILGFIPVTHGGVPKQSIAWIGYPTGGTMSGGVFFLAVYKVNVAAGTATWVYNTADISASVGTGTNPVWNYFNLASGNYFTPTQGDVYCVVATVLNVTYNFLCKPANTAPLIPSAVYPITRSGATYQPPSPGFDHISTGAGHGVWGTTLNEPITIGATANFVCVPVAISYTTATPPTTFAIDIGGTSLPQIGSAYVFATSGATSFALRWYGMVFTPGQFGTSNTVHITISGGTAGLFDAKALTYSWISGASVVGNASGTSATVASTVSLNGCVTNVIACSTNNAFNIGSPNIGTMRSNLAYSSGVNYAMMIADCNVATSGSAGWSFSPGGTANWGISGLYLSPLYIASPPAATGFTVGVNTSPTAVTPFMGLSSTVGTTQNGPIPPVLVPIYGSQTVTNYAVTYPWLNWVDLVVCGAGAGGDAGGTLQGSSGGAAGAYNGITLSKAQLGTSNITWTIGAGGAGGASTSAGGATGGSSSVTVPGWSTLTGAGGTGHGSAVATGSINAGAGASVPTYNFTNHYGGTDSFPGGAGGGSAQSAGQQPGGGGAGGNAVSYGSYVFGAVGGAGIGYAYIYQ